MVLATMLRLAARSSCAPSCPVLEEIGDEQEQAAATLGATAFQTFRAITLPVDPRRARLRRRARLARCARRVRRGRRRVRPARRPDPDRHAATSQERFQNFDQTGAYAAATRCWPSSRSSPSLHQPSSCDPKETAPMSIEVAQRHQDLRRLRRARRRLRRDPDRVADRAARPERRRQVDPAAGHRRARAARTPGTVEIEGRDATAAAAAATATSASSSSTTPRSST